MLGQVWISSWTNPPFSHPIHQLASFELLNSSWMGEEASVLMLFGHQSYVHSLRPIHHISCIQSHSVVQKGECQPDPVKVFSTKMLTSLCTNLSVLQCSKWSWEEVFQGIKKGESGLFLTTVLTLWGGGHIAHHVWRRVIVPSDLAQSFGAICAHYRYRMIHRAITSMRIGVEFTWERQLTLNKIIWRA